MRLTFVINSLRLGGAQRALINIAEAFHQHGHSVSLITLYRKETDFFTLSDDIAYTALGVEGDTKGVFQKVFQNARRVAALRRAIISDRPEIVLSFLPETNILVLLALAGSRRPCMIVEQNDPLRSSLDVVWRLLRRLTYPAASCLVCSSQGVSDGFVWMPNAKRRVIFNTIASVSSDLPAMPQAYAEQGRKHITAMGRLNRQKGFDLLIDAFAKIAVRYPDWDLTIWGEGTERPALEGQIKQLNLQNHVFLPGSTIDPLGVMKAAHLFVLSSRFEGFGNVLIEAMACGLPVISFDCPSGPGEIIQRDENGILVTPEDVEALSKAIEKLIQNEHRREMLAIEGKKASEKFSVVMVYPQWEALISQLLSP